MSKLFTRDGFDIHFEAIEEDMAVEDMLSVAETGCDHSDTIRKVNNGDYEYFCAVVSAHKNGIPLAIDHLGGCIYDTEEAFYTEKNGYFDDMVSTVIAEAKETIQELCEA